MTYAERSYLYILRRAVRRNLRGCHRHSSPTYLPTALLLPLHPPVVRTILTRSHPFLYFIVLFLSLLFAFPELSPIRSLFSFLSLRFCFVFFFLPSYTSETSRVPFLVRRISTFFFCQRRFFQSSLDYSLTSVFTFWIRFIYLFFALFKLILN